LRVFAVVGKRKKNNGGFMYKCQIRLQIIREKEKLEELKSFKLIEDKVRLQQKRHLKIIREKIKQLEKELNDE
jgi:hypothetical protein